MSQTHEGVIKGVIVEEERDNEGAGDQWRICVKLIQTILERGDIPQQMQWMVIVPLSKGRGDYSTILKWY